MPFAILLGCFCLPLGARNPYEHTPRWRPFFLSAPDPSPPDPPPRGLRDGPTKSKSADLVILLLMIVGQ